MKTLIAIMLIVGLDLSWWWLVAIALVLAWDGMRSLARDQKQANRAVEPNNADVARSS